MKVWSWRDAVRQSDIKPHTKLVLYTLSVYMNEIGSGAFPSYKTLADDCGCSKRTVMRHIEEAVQYGFLKKEKKLRENGSYSSNVYIASYPDGVVSPQTLGSVTTDTRGSVTSVTPINTPVNNTPVKEKKETKVSTKKPIAKKPDDVSEELWSEFLDYRRGMKARLTPTALKGFVREASNANISLSQAIEHTMLMGWRGFKAEWYNNQTKTKQNEDEPKW